MSKVCWSVACFFILACGDSSGAGAGEPSDSASHGTDGERDASGEGTSSDVDAGTEGELLAPDASDDVEPESVGESFTLGPEGGTYELENGIVLRAPPGAVEKDTEISLSLIPVGELDAIFERRGVPRSRLLAALDAQPDGLEFERPIRVTLPVELDAGEVPWVHQVELDEESYWPTATETTTRGPSGALSLTLTHFSEYTVEQLEEMRRGEEDCRREPCRCGAYHTEQSDGDAICESGDCQITRSELTITYLDCDGLPEETSSVTEMNGECQPRMTLSADRNEIDTSDQTTVTAEVGLACDPRSGESIRFSHTGPAGLSPTSALSDDVGRASSNVTSGEEEGLVRVEASATLEYSTYELSASAGGITETVEGPTRSGEARASTNITVKEDFHLEGSRWQIVQKMYLDYSSNFGCENFELFSCEPELATGYWMQEVYAEFVVGELDGQYADLTFENVRGSYRFSDFPQREVDEWHDYQCDGYAAGQAFDELSTVGAYGPMFITGDIIPSVLEVVDDSQGDDGPFFQFQILPSGSGGGYTTPCTEVVYDGYGGSDTFNWDDLRDKDIAVALSHVVPAKNGSVTHEPSPEATHLSGFYTISWKCIADCNNNDCSEPCDDGNDCTTDRCEEGSGCIYEPQNGGTCDDQDECTGNGECVNGACAPGPEWDCDDDNPCTYDTCHSQYGCLHDENSVPLENIDPNDCWKQQCIGGVPYDVPDDSETPLQESPSDCYQEVCLNGVLSLPDDREVPPQAAPDDCYREVCWEGDIESEWDDSEPGCMN